MSFRFPKQTVSIDANDSKTGRAFFSQNRFRRFVWIKNEEPDCISKSKKQFDFVPNLTPVPNLAPDKSTSAKRVARA